MSGNILDEVKKNQEDIKSSLEELIKLVKRMENFESKEDYPITLTVAR